MVPAPLPEPGAHALLVLAGGALLHPPAQHPDGEHAPPAPPRAWAVTPVVQCHRVAVGISRGRGRLTLRGFAQPCSADQSPRSALTVFKEDADFLKIAA